MTRETGTASLTPLTGRSYHARVMSIERLLRLVAATDRLLIQTHDFPDPDELPVDPVQFFPDIGAAGESCLAIDYQNLAMVS